MSASVPQYDKSLPDSSRGLSAPLWRQQLSAYVSNDPQFGYRFQDDFVNRNALSATTTPAVNDRWSVHESATTGGTNTLTSVANPDGEARLGSTGTSNHQGAELAGPPAIVLPSHSSDARGVVVYEARFDKEDAYTIFAGLSEDGDTFLSSTSALPHDASDYIGYYTADNGVTWTFQLSTDNDGGTAVQDSYTIPASLLNSSGYNKLGFRVNTDKSIELCVNGKWIPKAVHGLSASALPIETLVPRFSCTAGGGTTAPNILLDRVDVFVAAI